MKSKIVLIHDEFMIQGAKMEVILTNIQHDLGFRYAKVEARRTLVFLNVVSTFQQGIWWYYDAGKPRRATIAGR